MQLGAKYFFFIKRGYFTCANLVCCSLIKGLYLIFHLVALEDLFAQETNPKTYAQNCQIDEFKKDIF